MRIVYHCFPIKENLSELISENRLILKPPLRKEEVIKQFNSLKNNIEVVNLSAAEFDQMLISDKDKKIAMEFDNNNVDSEYFTTSTFNNVVRSQGGNFFILHENIRSFGRNFDEFHSYGSELCRVADVIVLSETWFSANTCDIQGYARFHTYRADKYGGGVSVLHIDTCGQFFSVSCIL